MMMWFLIAALALVGCQSATQEKTIPVESEKKMSQTAPPPARMMDTNTHVVREYPCPGCGVVKIEKKMPEVVMVNATFEYHIMVTNMTDMPLADIVVTDQLHSNLKYEKSVPAAQVSGNTLTWTMDMLAPKTTQTIRVMGAAAAPGIVKSCADVTYKMPACTETPVVQPEIMIAKSAPAEVLVCDEIPMKITVSNPGTGTARNVVITDQLPNGMTTTTGRSDLRIEAGDLEPGKSKTYVVQVKAEKVGSYTNVAMVNAEGGLKGQSEQVKVNVVQPKLEIDMSGPQREYLNRPITYNVTVKNTGSANAADTVLMVQVPGGARDIKANMGTISGSTIRWELGTLRMGETKNFSFTYMVTDAVDLMNTARVMGTCAPEATASARTSVTGIAALLLEVVDEADPILIGNNEIYTITVTNQGTSDATNVKIVCTLEDTMEYVTSTGPTSASTSGKTITFAPLAKISPKQEVAWHVTVKALSAGDVRFSVTMNSDQLGRDVMETESTNFYQ